MCLRNIKGFHMLGEDCAGYFLLPAGINPQIQMSDTLQLVVYAPYTQRDRNNSTFVIPVVLSMRSDGHKLSVSDIC